MGSDREYKFVYKQLYKLLIHNTFSSDVIYEYLKKEVDFVNMYTWTTQVESVTIKILRQVIDECGLPLTITKQYKYYLKEK